MKEMSRTVERFTESVIREMTRICDAAGGLNLAQGFPDFASPTELKAAAIEAISKDFNQYPVTFGEPELRRAITSKGKRYNGLDYDPESEVTVTCGATEAMIATLKAIINPGDEIIIFEPFYENYGPDCMLSGATPRYVALDPPDWSYSLEALKAAFNERTKAIIINTPNNPTGKVFSMEELSDIAELCRKWDAYAVTDEIYEHILYDGEAHTSLAALPGMRERTVTINSVSKTYSVTGWRVGWAIAPAEVTRRIRKVHDFFTIGAPTPLQHASAHALSSLGPEYYSKLKDRYTEAREFLYGLLKLHGFKPTRPKGAYYIMAGISELRPMLGASDDFSFSKKLIELTGVATVPGSSFHSVKDRGKDTVRFCFCKRFETLQAVEKAFERLKAVKR